MNIYPSGGNQTILAVTHGHSATYYEELIEAPPNYLFATTGWSPRTYDQYDGADPSSKYVGGTLGDYWEILRIGATGNISLANQSGYPIYDSLEDAWPHKIQLNYS